MSAKSHIRTHMFVEAASLRKDHNGQPYCTCGLPKVNASHDLPDNPGRDVDSRRVGER
jgi:hypothetical protein